MRFFHPGHPLRMPEPPAPRLYPSNPRSIYFETPGNTTYFVDAPRRGKTTFFTVQDMLDIVRKKSEEDVMWRPHHYDFLSKLWASEITKAELESLRIETGNLPTIHLPRKSGRVSLKIHTK